MTVGFLFGSKNFCKLLCVYWEVFDLHGYDWIHWVAKSCITTAYRWLFRDSPLVIFGPLAPRGDHLSTRVRFVAMAARVYTGPSASRNTFSVSTITDGYARAGSYSSCLPLSRPDCTLSRLRAEEYDRPVTQSIATPEPSSRTIPTLDRTLVAR